MLTGVLMAAQPERLAEASYALTVGTDIQAEAVRRFLDPITSRLRDNLGNDSLTLEVKVCQGDLPPAFWTEQQVLDHLIETTPAVAELIAKYKMRLV